MEFAYTAKSSTGQVLNGVVVADRVQEARQQLRSDKLFVVSIEPTRSTNRATGRWKGQVPRRELLNLTTQLAIMTRSGIDIAGALESLSNQTKNPRLRATLQQIHTDVSGGQPVSKALKPHEHIFGPAYIASVAAGEASGQLPEILYRLAQILRSEIRNRNTVRALLMYPVLLVSVSSAVVMAILCFVLPQFGKVFDQVEIPIPAITQVLLGISSFVRGNAWWWAPLLVAITIGLIVFRLSARGREWWDRMILNAIGLRSVTRALMVGRAFRLLGIMIESGVPILEGVRMTRGSMKNALFRQLFHDLEEDILNGRELSRSLATADFIPSAATEMVITAERTGTLGMVAQLMGEHYEEEAEMKLRELATVLEPSIIITMGFIVGLVVLAVMLPMFDMATLNG